jgi:hypothetical protein
MCRNGCVVNHAFPIAVPHAALVQRFLNAKVLITVAPRPSELVPARKSGLALSSDS